MGIESYDFGANIRLIRETKHLKVYDIINKLKENGVDITPPTYYAWENGGRTVPHKYVIPLCIALGVTVDFLYNVKHDSELLQDKIDHVEVVKDFLCMLNDDICKELIAISKYWDGNIFTALALLGTYSAQPVEMRRDVADLCFHNFECAVRDGSAEKHISKLIDTDFCRKEIDNLYK